MLKGSGVTVEKFFNDNEKSLSINLLSGKKGLQRLIREGTAVRAGLALAGSYEYLADKRIHILGMGEMAFLRTVPQNIKEANVRGYLSHQIPCLILTRGLAPEPIFITCSNEFDVPIFLSPLVTTTVVTGITFYLDRELAPSVSLHGSLVDIHGSGVLILGASGIGKSETSLALLRRGHALVGDDLILIKCLYGDVLVGETANESMRGLIELRGVGLVNLIRLFGSSIFRERREIEVVVTLKSWGEVGNDRPPNLENQTYRILGVDLPHISIPVAPGRDVASLIEVAVQEIRMKKLFDKDKGNGAQPQT